VIPIQTQVQCVTCGIYFDQIQEHLCQVKICHDGIVLLTNDHNFPFTKINCMNNINNDVNEEDMLDNTSDDDYFCDPDEEDLIQNDLVMADKSSDEYLDQRYSESLTNVRKHLVNESSHNMNHIFNENTFQSLINGDFESFTRQFDDDIAIVVDNADGNNEELDNINNLNEENNQLPTEQFQPGTLVSQNVLFLPINTSFFQLPFTTEDAFMVNLYHLCD